ncbi:hypothetical protein ACH5RR_041603 [Cinchona calisaya]|uniref:Hydroxyproline-rich glycoprotein family protein n=1 Tax=Cinchona calisaya TaxID=153742 RepID=A0ABD2XVT2_9GENT
MRGVNGIGGDMRGGGGGGGGGGGNNALETIHAAATAIAAAENRVPPPAVVQKRRWASCWSLYWCFGSRKHTKRIGHSVLVPEPTAMRVNPPTAENRTQAPSLVLPFVAPPSSPASFLQSEPPSATQSPAGLLSLTSISASMYSPGGPASMFAIGPYAHETQLVTPPVFSTFTTESSTAPFTPPPESVQMTTTPSSPEVPFARLLDPIHQNGEDGQRFPLPQYEFQTGQRFPLPQYEFQTYQLQPGSPVSHLISPSSGTSSPFPDGEFVYERPHFLEFGRGDPPKLLNLEKIAPHEWGSRQGSGTITPDAVAPRRLLDPQKSDASTVSNSYNVLRNDETAVDHRVSFEITAEEVVRCVEKKPAALAKATLASVENVACNVRTEDNPKEMENAQECCAGEASRNASGRASLDGEGGQWYQKHRSITLGSAKEFNFDSVDEGNSEKPNIGSDWWANEKVQGKEGGASKNWSFPVMQPGVS